MYGVLLTIAAIILVLILIAVIVLLVRVRLIGRIVGTFECWWRPDMSSGWVAGMARFGRDDFQWFRLIGFGYGPQFRLGRQHTTVSNPISTAEGNIVEVIVESEGRRDYFAMRAEWYNGLVSWNESSPPRERGLY